LMALELRNRLERRLGVKLPVTVIWSSPTIRRLADDILAALVAAPVADPASPTASPPEEPAEPRVGAAAAPRVREPDDPSPATMSAVTAAPRVREPDARPVRAPDSPPRGEPDAPETPADDLVLAALAEALTVEEGA